MKNKLFLGTVLVGTMAVLATGVQERVEAFIFTSEQEQIIRDLRPPILLHPIGKGTVTLFGQQSRAVQELNKKYGELCVQIYSLLELETSPIENSIYSRIVGKIVSQMSSLGIYSGVMWKPYVTFSKIFQEYNNVFGRLVGEVLQHLKMIELHNTGMLVSELGIALGLAEQALKDLFAMKINAEEKMSGYPSESMTTTALQVRMREKLGELHRRLLIWMDFVADQANIPDAQRRAGIIKELRILERLIIEIEDNRPITEINMVTDFPITRRIFARQRSTGRIFRGRQAPNPSEESLHLTDNYEVNQILAFFLTLITEDSSSPIEDEDRRILGALQGTYNLWLLSE